MKKKGLVLSGGGARAAYQVGVVKALAEIWGKEEFPFQIITGISAGAINAASLASGVQDFQSTVDKLFETWKALTPNQVYKTDPMSFAKIGLKWGRDLSAGGFLGSSEMNFLLDTEPLWDLLDDLILPTEIQANIQKNKIEGFGITATNYETGTAITFYESGDPAVQDWVRSTRMGVQTRTELDHVMASAAIPVFFEPVQINGIFFGDGCVRMSSPLSPAIHMGAEAIMAVGIRYQRTREQTIAINRVATRKSLAISDIAGVLMNAVFLEAMEGDLERLIRINQTLKLIPQDSHKDIPHNLRPIEVLGIHPSRDLGALAEDQYQKFPRLLQYLLKGIGAGGTRGWDLLSYLAFQPEYVRPLLELGYQDTYNQRAEVEAFFRL